MLREVLRGASALLTPDRPHDTASRTTGAITPLLLSSAETSGVAAGESDGGDGPDQSTTAEVDPAAAFLAEEAERSREFDSQLEAHMSRLRAALDMSQRSANDSAPGP